MAPAQHRRCRRLRPCDVTARSNRATPTLVMLGTEDTVIGEEGNAAGRAYFETHTGPRWETQPRRPASHCPAPPRHAPPRTATPLLAAGHRPLIHSRQAPARDQAGRARLLHLVRAVQPGLRQRHRREQQPLEAGREVHAAPHRAAARGDQRIRPRLPQRPPAPGRPRARARRLRRHLPAGKPLRCRGGCLEVMCVPRVLISIVFEREILYRVLFVLRG